MNDVNILSDYNLICLSRIGLSILLGFLLGLERELTGKFAGLRTHILVCVGACLFTVLSIYSFKIPSEIAVAGINDPARIAAQIITGIGFIGAGTVMRSGTNIIGITTAATLWICAAVGMACGAGEFIIATITTIASVLVLILIRIFEKRFIRERSSSHKHMEIRLSTSIDNMDLVSAVITENFTKIIRLEKKVSNGSDLKFRVTVLTTKKLHKINKILTHLDCINSLEIQETYE